MSSAYKIIEQPRSRMHKLPKSSTVPKYTANKNGDSTDPCLAPKFITK